MKKNNKPTLINKEFTTTFWWRIALCIFWVGMCLIEFGDNGWTTTAEGILCICLLAASLMLAISAGIEYGVQLYKMKEEIKAEERKSHKEKFVTDIIYTSYAITPEQYNILVEWKKEAKVNFIAIGTRHESNVETLIIYSNRPGCLIGKAGCTIDKYKKELFKAPYNKFTNIELVQTEGIVLADQQVDVNKYYLEEVNYED